MIDLKVNFPKKNTIAKFIPITLNIIRSVLTPILTLLLSYIIIDFYSKSLWGEFVEIQLYLFIVLIISDWGTKTHLQKVFSKNPRNIIKTWQNQFIIRLPILFLCLISLFLLIDSNNIIFIALWLLSAYIYNSFLSILFFNREYILLIITEVCSFLLLNSLFIITSYSLTVNELILFYSIYIFSKATTVTIRYIKFLNFKAFKPDFKRLKFGLPYLLIGITGFLHSKIDVYTYAFFSDSTALGEYQIVSSFFIFSQSVITILIFPYIKNIYRINSKVLNKIRVKLTIFGVFINIIIVLLIAFLLKKYFSINLTFTQYLVGFFIGYPSYIYSIKVFEYFKLNMEKNVVFISLIGLSLNFTLSLILLSFNSNIISVLLANALTQIVTMIIYFTPSLLTKKGRVK